MDQAFITPICCLVVALEHHCTALDLRAYVNLNKDQQAQTVAHSKQEWQACVTCMMTRTSMGSLSSHRVRGMKP
jgi:hypothetical protein